jgi:hypothetical protein
VRRMTSGLQRAVSAASRISGCREQLISMTQFCRIVSSALGTRCTAGAEMASSIFRFRTIEIGPGIVFNRTVFIHTNRLDGETATNGRRVGISGCSASKDLGRRTTRGGRLLCKQDSQVGSIPTRSTRFSPVAYARSIRSAENGESSVQLAGLAPIGEWCNGMASVPWEHVV